MKTGGGAMENGGKVERRHLKSHVAGEWRSRGCRGLAITGIYPGIQIGPSAFTLATWAIRQEDFVQRGLGTRIPAALTVFVSIDQANIEGLLCDLVKWICRNFYSGDLSHALAKPWRRIVWYRI